MDFSLVCKAHAVSATFFGLVFLVASFGWSLPIIGPEALLAGWDMDNAAFAYLIRFTSGVMFGFGMMEWVFAEQEKMKDIFVIYHAISAVLLLYSSMAAATYWLGWLYAVLITAFGVAGMIAKPSGYSRV